MSALSLITLSTALGLPNPLNAMQILWINVIARPPSCSAAADVTNNFCLSDGRSPCPVRIQDPAPWCASLTVILSRRSLGVDPVNRDIMRRPPRPKKTPILSRRLLQRVAFSAILIVCGVLFVLARELGDGSMASRDQTMVRASFPRFHLDLNLTPEYIPRLSPHSSSSTSLRRSKTAA